MFGLKTHFAKQAIGKMLDRPDFTADTAMEALERFREIEWRKKGASIGLLDQIVDKTPAEDRAQIALEAAGYTAIFEDANAIKLRRRSLTEAAALPPKERAIAAFNVWGKTVSTFLKSFDKDLAERSAQAVYDALKEMPPQERIKQAGELSAASRNIRFSDMSKNCFTLATRGVEELPVNEQPHALIGLYKTPHLDKTHDIVIKLNELVDKVPNQDRFVIATYIHNGAYEPTLKARALHLMQTHVGDSRPEQLDSNRQYLQRVLDAMAPRFKAAI